ncbi:ClbS/DfsB family four-helix bundle protein [Yoonia sp. R2331]|uniref:ClbS/DfsB family four-helix bundle protein n=1 Tax=Yoonia sp. R2331 TaxID=3237238 RepID=UPI0034E45310
MPATDKSGLMKITEKEFAKLSALIGGIDAATAEMKRDDDTSIKDVVAHRAHWINLFLGWYADGQAGKTVHFPAPGYKWNDLKRYNADLRARQADLDWAAARSLLQKNHDRLMSFLQTQDNAALFGGPMKGARNAWTPGRWAEAAGPSHYRSAGKYIRMTLKTAD